MIVIPCVLIAWLAASGPVDHYDLIRNGELVGSEQVCPSTVPADQRCGLACIDDIGVEQRFEVVAVDADGSRGPLSEPLFLTRRYYTDYDHDGITTFKDFGVWSRSFGVCDNGRFEVPCE